MLVEHLECRLATGRRWQVVRLTDSNGSRGLGEVSDVGVTTDEIAEAAAALDMDESHLPLGLRQTTARGGLSCALTDLAARRRGESLFGNSDARVGLYANLNRARGATASDRTPGDARRLRVDPARRP